MRGATLPLRDATQDDRDSGSETPPPNTPAARIAAARSFTASASASVRPHATRPTLPLRRNFSDSRVAAGSQGSSASPTSPTAYRRSAAKVAFMAAADEHSKQRRAIKAAKKEKRRAEKKSRRVVLDAEAAHLHTSRLVRGLVLALALVLIAVIWLSLRLLDRGPSSVARLDEMRRDVKVHAMVGSAIGLLARTMHLRRAKIALQNGTTSTTLNSLRDAMDELEALKKLVRAERLAGRHRINVLLVGRRGVSMTSLAESLALGQHEIRAQRVKAEPAAWHVPGAPSAVAYPIAFGDDLDITFWDTYAMSSSTEELRRDATLSEGQRARAVFEKARHVRRKIRGAVKTVDIVLLCLSAEETISNPDFEVIELLDIAFGGWVWDRFAIVFTRADALTPGLAWEAVVAQTELRAHAIADAFGDHRPRHPLHGQPVAYDAVPVPVHRDTAARWRTNLFVHVLEHSTTLAQHRGTPPPSPPIDFATWSPGCEVFVSSCQSPGSAVRSAQRVAGDLALLPGAEALPPSDRAVLEKFSDRGDVEAVLYNRLRFEVKVTGLKLSKLLQTLQPAGLREVAQWLLMTPCERLLVANGYVSTFAAVRTMGAERIVADALAVVESRTQHGTAESSLRTLLAAFRAGGGSVELMRKVEEATVVGGKARTVLGISQMLTSKSLQPNRLPIKSTMLPSFVRNLTNAAETTATANTQAFALHTSAEGNITAAAAAAAAARLQGGASVAKSIVKANQLAGASTISPAQKTTLLKCIKLATSSGYNAALIAEQVEDESLVLVRSQDALAAVIASHEILAGDRTQRDICGFAVLSPMDRLLWTIGEMTVNDLRTMSGDDVVNTALEVIVQMSANDDDVRFGHRTIKGLQMEHSDPQREINFVQLAEYYTLPSRFPKTGTQMQPIAAARYPATCSMLATRYGLALPPKYRVTGPQGAVGIRAQTQMLSVKEIASIKGYLDRARGSGRVERMLVRYLDAQLPTGAAKGEVMAQAARYLLMTPLERVLIEAGRPPRAVAHLNSEDLVNSAIVELAATTSIALPQLQKYHQDFNEHGSLSLIYLAENTTATAWIAKTGVKIKPSSTSDWLSRLEHGWGHWWCGMEYRWLAKKK